MKKIVITQVKSAIDRPERQKLTLKALGLNKMNASREIEATPQALGMIRAVLHLLKVEEISDVQEPSSVAALQSTLDEPIVFRQALEVNEANEV